jgi:hypothetical protein
MGVFEENALPMDQKPETPSEGTISSTLCPFCSAPWSRDNIKIYDVDAENQCESGRFDPENCTIEITCHSCKRLMYKKEGFIINW